MGVLTSWFPLRVWSMVREWIFTLSPGWARSNSTSCSSKDHPGLAATT